MNPHPVATRVLGGAVTWYFGDSGAHFRFPGFLYTRNSGVKGWALSRTWRLLGLVCLRHLDAQDGTLKHVKPPGWSVTFATIRWNAVLRKAENYVS